MSEEFEPSFHAAKIAATDLHFVHNYGATAGPTLASLIIHEPRFADLWHSEPLLVLCEKGMTLRQCEDHAHREDYDAVSMCSWTEAADLYASITAIVQTWTEDQQTRFRARCDRSVAAWKANVRKAGL